MKKIALLICVTIFTFSIYAQNPGKLEQCKKLIIGNWQNTKNKNTTVTFIGDKMIEVDKAHGNIDTFAYSIGFTESKQIKLSQIWPGDAPLEFIVNVRNSSLLMTMIGRNQMFNYKRISSSKSK